MQSACENKLRLLKGYEHATEQYFQRLHELREKTLVSPLAEYERLRETVEQARAKSEFARAALALHISEHGC